MGVTQIEMPQLGESVTEGTVDRWLKKVGDFVRRDEALVEVVTDKVNAEIPSPFEGRLVDIAVPEGTTVPVGTLIARIEVEGVADTAPEEPEPEPVAASPASSAVAAPAGASAERRRYSPAVRRLAEENEVDLTRIEGTGLGGRVTRDDVLAFLEHRPAPLAEPAPAPSPSRQPVPAAEGELVPHSVMRRSIAERMQQSVNTIPHAWTLQEVDVTELVRYREQHKDGFRDRNGAPLTYLPFIVQILCDALETQPNLNSTWTDEGVLVRSERNIGIAVSVPDGLMVPVIRGADRLGFVDLARCIDDLVTRSRSRRLVPDDVSGGTFTLNNTGVTGSVASAPIINQGQAGILTTEAIVRRPVVIGDGIAIRHMMNVCLSFDHRILDGMAAGRFLTMIKERLESWSPDAIRM
jgi:2-oxoisovalerate dehydrogenase E2 component (dihydrolipoyl transacylase)